MKKLCSKKIEGTLDIWINPEGIKFGDDITPVIITTINGANPNSGFDILIPEDSFKENSIQSLDTLMGRIGRDTRNWDDKDIVIHWGVHTWKFYNSRNISEIDLTDEYSKNLDDIIYFNDIDTEE